MLVLDDSVYQNTNNTKFWKTNNIKTNITLKTKQPTAYHLNNKKILKYNNHKSDNLTYNNEKTKKS